MKNDNCYIDGISCLQRFGVWVTRGGYDDLLRFPSMAEPDKNDWPDEDGIEVDLSDPHLEKKEVAISFLSSGGVYVGEFLEFLSAPGLHTLRIPSLEREWQLRMDSEKSCRVYPTATAFTLNFVEDRPVRPAAGLPDPGLPIRPSLFEMDGVDLADYGVIVDESLSAFERMPEVKQNLRRKISILDGEIYDAENVVFSSKEATFKCRLKAADMGSLWSCYDAFFGALIRPGERSLYVDYMGSDFPCYYSKATGFKLLGLAPAMISFNLTLVFTVFRIGGTDYLLASQGGNLVISEDGRYCIDVEPCRE